MGLLVSVRNIAKAYTHKALFSGITLGVYEGERIGMIGPNGSGKSTFLKILAGTETADSGAVERKRDLKMAYVAQRDTFDQPTPRAVLLAALANEHIDPHMAENRVDKMLTRMDFTQPDAPNESLSGGWRKRLAIAESIIKEPELLLLDEPTNHLDLEGILWLEKFLKDARFATVVVTHDRYFLENMTTRIVEIAATYSDGFLSVEGPYSEFLRRREEFLEGQQAQEESLKNRVRQEIEWLSRGAKARRRKSKFRIGGAHEAIANLKDINTRNTSGDAQVDIEFTASERKTNKLLAAHNISKNRGGRTLFSNVDLILSPGSRLGLLGPNGSGKSTLMHILNGDLDSDSGTIKRAHDLRVVFFDQARKALEQNMTLRQALSPTSDSVVYQGRVIHVNSWAKRFLFRYEQMDHPISALSGGEQARILIAKLMQDSADVLMMDEPTNDLDIPSLEVLEESLAEFPGAVVLVTHDRYLLDRLATSVFSLDGKGGAKEFVDLDQWAEAKEAADVAEAAARSAALKAASDSAAPAKNSQQSGRKRLNYMEQREWDSMEQSIMEAEEKVESLQHQMEAAMSDPQKLQDICQQLTQAQEKIQTLYARWEFLENKLQGD